MWGFTLMGMSQTFSIHRSAAACLAFVALTRTVTFLSFRIWHVDPVYILTATVPSKNGDTDDKVISSTADKMKHVSLCGNVLRTVFSCVPSPSDESVPEFCRDWLLGRLVCCIFWEDSWFSEKFSVALLLTHHGVPIQGTRSTGQCPALLWRVQSYDSQVYGKVSEGHTGLKRLITP